MPRARPRTGKWTGWPTDCRRRGSKAWRHRRRPVRHGRQRRAPPDCSRRTATIPASTLSSARVLRNPANSMWIARRWPTSGSRTASGDETRRHSRLHRRVGGQGHRCGRTASVAAEQRGQTVRGRDLPDPTHWIATQKLPLTQPGPPSSAPLHRPPPLVDPPHRRLDRPDHAGQHLTQRLTLPPNRNTHRDLETRAHRSQLRKTVTPTRQNQTKTRTLKPSPTTQPGHMRRSRPSTSPWSPRRRVTSGVMYGEVGFVKIDRKRVSMTGHKKDRLGFRNLAT